MSLFARRPFWEREGLCFSCTRCGDCCRREGFVRVASDEAAQIAVRLGGEEAVPADFDGELWSRASDGSWEIEVTDPIRGCPLLGGNGCTVQDIKPRQCATYPFWPEVVRNERTWRNEARACEGIGSGRHYGADAIHALLAGVESTTVEEPSNE